MYNTLTLMFRHLTQSLRLMIGVPGLAASKEATRLEISEKRYEDFSFR